MREQTKQFEELLAEYKKLKYEIFGDDAKFAALGNDAKTKKLAARYDQLFQFFYPQFRTTNWISPLNP